MIAEREVVAEDVAFQINRADVGPLFIDRLQLSWNPMCPLAEDLQGYVKGSAPGSESIGVVANHPMAPTVGAIITAPDLRIVHRSGGGTLQIGALYACRALALGRETMAVVAPSFEDSIMIRLFPSADSYLMWWLDTFATPAEDTVPNFMPPTLALESLLYLLHAIDAFRRVAFESLLNYAPNPEPSVKPADFISTMERSIRSKDIRWLLPTFLQLTPGLSRYSLEPRANHMDPLLQNAFLTAAKDAKTGQEVFLFGEGGRMMGVEFYRTWLRAVGFAPEILTPQGPRMLPAAFLAPTAICNHLMRLEEDGSGRAKVNHQAMTRSELARKLGEMLTAALNLEIGAIPDPVPTPAAASPAGLGAVAPAPGLTPAPATIPTGSTGRAPEVQTATCPNCGAAIKPGARFCAVCGGAVQATAAPVVPDPAPLPANCGKCGNAVPLGTKFCGKCGAPVS